MKCFECGLDSEDLVMKTLATGKKVMWSKGQEPPHDCKPPEIIEYVKCPKCDPLTRKAMDRKKLYNHLKREHL